VIVVEFNAALPVSEAVSMPYDPLYRWAGEAFIGQSLMASKKLGEQNGYSLVYAAAPNAFLVLCSELPAGYVEVSANYALGPTMALLIKFLPFVVRLRNKRWNRDLGKFPWVRV
jgi:hypothetical protein